MTTTAGIFWALAYLVGSSGIAKDDRLPIPDPGAQQEARNLIRNLLKEEYARGSPADRMALAKNLLQQGLEVKDNPAIQYVLFQEARSLAADAGDVPLALQAVAELSTRFKVNELDLKCRVLSTVGLALRHTAERRTVVDRLLALADEAMERGDHETAVKSCEAAASLAGRMEDPPLTARIREKTRLAEGFKARRAGEMKGREATPKSLEGVGIVLPDKLPDLMKKPEGSLAQGGVHLRNGKWLSGEIMVEEGDHGGFWIKRWDGHDPIYVRWSQISANEKERLLHGPPPPPTSAMLIEGIRVTTPYRVVTGIVIREDPVAVHIKTRWSRSLVAVPKEAIQKREKVQLIEAEVFNPEERVEIRAARIDPADAEGFLRLGKFAESLGLHERAEPFYRKALAADPTRGPEIQKLLAALQALLREIQAARRLQEVLDILERTDFDEALKQAEKFLMDFDGTDTAAQNKNLVALIQSEAVEYALRRAEYLARRVPYRWRHQRAVLLAQYAGSASPTLARARAKTRRIDEEIQEALSKRLKATPEEIRTAWEGRDERPERADFGSGTWIVRGGQNGGLDTDEVIMAGPAGQDPGIKIAVPVGGLVLMLDPTPPPPKQLGQPLLTDEDWWNQVSYETRKSWLEAEYVSQSPFIHKVGEVTLKCPACFGMGLLKALRRGRTAIVICYRCHGIREDVIIRYW